MTNIIIPDSVYALKYTLNDLLYPEIAPIREGRLKVSEQHELWYAEYGNPEGVPVIFLHGGPGAGCSPHDARFFDPTFYRIILFDQRGSGRSTPLYELKGNNTQNLIADIEKLRNHLAVSKWLVFGGSWGSTLSILYGQNHPGRCLGFVLRGIFTGSKREADNLYAMGNIFPEIYDEFAQFIPEDERDDLLAAYFKRFCDPDPEICVGAARSFVKYDLTAAFLMDSREKVERILNNEGVMLAMSRFFAHYVINQCFIAPNQIMDDMHKISHLPAIIVHGRYDIICKVEYGYNLHKAWPGSELFIIQDAGHASTEPGIAKALVYATQKMQNLV